MELCYANNPKSLFRKYAHLVTDFSNSPEGRYFLSQNAFFKPQDRILLLLPNGWLELNRGVFSTHSLFASLLIKTLLKIDIAQERYSMSNSDLLEMMFIDLGLHKFSFSYPQVLLTTSTFNPDANPESTSVDGVVLRSGVDETFSTIRGGAGTSAADSSGDTTSFRLTASTTSSQYQRLERGIFLFDTSSLTGAANISSAQFSIYPNSRDSTLTDAWNITSSNPASDTALASTDYDVGDFGSTDFVTSEPTISGMTLSAFNDYTLNSSGIDNIAKTAISKFATRIAADIDNSAPTWASGADAFITADHADATNDPKLQVTFTKSGLNLTSKYW